MELLVILRELGRRINTIEKKPIDRNFYPCKYFSFCGGSGAGAIVAVMIGVYGWSVQKALFTYQCIYQKMLPDSLNSKGAPKFKDSDILPCLAWFQQEGGKQFADHCTPIPCAIFTRLATTHEPVVFKSYGSLPHNLSIPQILLAALAQNENFGALNIDGVKYQDILVRDCHAATILEATNYFQYKEMSTRLNVRHQVGLLVTIGGGGVKGGSGLVTRQPVSALTTRPSSIRRRPGLKSMASHASLKGTLGRLRKGWTSPNPSDHVEYRDKAADAIALLEGYSYHFALNIGNSYHTPGTDYGDSLVVWSESDKYFLDDTIDKRLSDCAEALVGLACHIDCATS